MDKNGKLTVTTTLPLNSSFNQLFQDNVSELPAAAAEPDRAPDDGSNLAARAPAVPASPAAALARIPPHVRDWWKPPRRLSWTPTSSARSLASGNRKNIV